jgi:hypothetical protein
MWTIALFFFFTAFIYPYCIIVGILSLVFAGIRLYSLSEKELAVLTGIYGFRQKITIPLNNIIDAKIVSKEGLYADDLIMLLRYSISKKVLLLHLKEKLPTEQHTKLLKYRDSFVEGIFRIQSIHVNNQGNAICLTKKPKGGFEPILYSIKQRIKPDEALPWKSSIFKKVVVGIYDLILISSISFVSYYIFIGKIRQIDLFLNILKLPFKLIKWMYFR